MRTQKELARQYIEGAMEMMKDAKSTVSLSMAFGYASGINAFASASGVIEYEEYLTYDHQIERINNRMHKVCYMAEMAGADPAEMQDADDLADWCTYGDY